MMLAMNRDVMRHGGACLGLMLILFHDRMLLADAKKDERQRFVASFRRRGRDDERSQPGRVRGQTTASARHLQPPMEKCGGPKDDGCPPTGSPTSAPSAQPSLSPAPTQSIPPSTSPTISTAPSFAPTPFPSASPSDQPSGVPTTSPRPSLTPSSSPSDGPSNVPSGIPTLEPTPKPSLAPTSTPSTSPSDSPRPTTSLKPTTAEDLNGFSTTVFIGPDKLPQANSTCRKEIPSNSESIEDQVIAFDYIANVKKGSNMTLVMSSISLRLQEELSQQYLTCQFASGPDFLTDAIGSLPGDVVNVTASCTDTEVKTGSDCYVVDGAFTATIFYLPDGTRRKRGLQVSDQNTPTTSSEQITDPNVYESFSTSLQAIFASGTLTGTRVTSLEFQGITNSDIPTAAPRTVDTPAVVGGSVGGFIALCLIALLVVLGIQSYRKRKRYPEQVGGGDFSNRRVVEGGNDGGDANFMRPYEDDPSAQEDQPFAHIPITSSPNSNDDDEATLFTQSHGAQNVRVVVFNEDDTLVSGAPPPVDLYDDDGKEPQPPRFLKMKDLRQDTPPREGLPSPSYYYQQSNPARRAYDVSDTVDL